MPRRVVTLPPAQTGAAALAFAERARRVGADLLEVRTDLHDPATLSIDDLAQQIPLLVAERGRPAPASWRAVAALLDGPDGTIVSEHFLAPLRPAEALTAWLARAAPAGAQIKHVEPLGALSEAGRLFETQRFLVERFGFDRVTVLATGPLALPFRAVLAERNALDYCALDADWTAAEGQRLLADAVRSADGRARAARTGARAGTRGPHVVLERALATDGDARVAGTRSGALTHLARAADAGSTLTADEPGPSDGDTRTIAGGASEAPTAAANAAHALRNEGGASSAVLAQSDSDATSDDGADRLRHRANAGAAVVASGSDGAIARARGRLGILGSGIAGSRSPRIHDQPFDRIDLPADTDIGALLDALLPYYRGLAITAPFKRAAARHVRADTEAVNTLIRRDGRWTAANTDVEGARAVLEALPRGEVIALGDGGATVALRAVCPELRVVTRAQVPETIRGPAVWTWPAHVGPPPGLRFHRDSEVAVIAYGAPARRIAAEIRARGGRPRMLGPKWFIAQARAQRALWRSAS
ncbi:MAG: shikimate dehydrogenase [Myxococcaceae bacterium]|nr:shikimate dehydrogenase [Myxococcaceae bacterium]